MFDIYKDSVGGKIFKRDYDSLGSVDDEISARVQRVFANTDKIVAGQFREKTDSGFEHDR